MLALVLMLAGCGNGAGDGQPTQEAVTTLTTVVTADTIQELDNYPNLETVDLSGSTCYPEILAYMQAHPDVAVTYTVDLGGTVVDGHAEEILLQPDTFRYAALLDSIRYMPDIKHVTLENTNLTYGEIQAFREFCPNIQVDYNVSILGVSYTEEITELDLSALTPDAVADVLPVLDKLPNVTFIQLMGEDGTSWLDVTDVKLLMDAAPHISYGYSFELFGQTISVDAERVEYVNVKIGNEGVDKIRQALDILPNCTYFLLDTCGIDNEIMAQLRDDYPDCKIVWRVWYGKQNDLTDEETIRHVYGLKDSNCENLKYFVDCKYMDLGHNTELSDFSFVAYMPELEIVIASGAPLTDLTPFSNCHKLLFLELAYCNKLEDLSPLGELESLKYLNISFTAVTDLTPIMGLELEKLSCLGGTVEEDQREAYLAAHPDCLLTHKGKQPYGYGWRYDDNGYTYSEIYRRIRDIFGYDNMVVD